MTGKISKLKNKRLFFVYALFALIFAFVLLRLFYVQVVWHSGIDKIVSRMVLKERVVEGKRGSILDTGGRPLAISQRMFTVFVDSKMVKDFNKVKKLLTANGVYVPQNNLKAFRNSRYAQLKGLLTEESVNKIRKENLAGIGFEEEFRRQYPQGSLLTPVLGMLGAGGEGRSGIELGFNSSLAGKQIRVKQTRDGAGRMLNNEIVDLSKVSGQDIRLTIDLNLQYIVEQELKKAFNENGAKNAVCIIQDPYTGEILAMASLPDFTPNTKVTDLSVLRNYAVSDVFEPGSTFKIVAIAGALDEGVIEMDDVFDLEGGRMRISGHTINDDEAHRVANNVGTLKNIMADSSNVGLVKIAQKLDKKTFYNYIRKFGFYSLTAIDLPGEVRGTLTDYRDWDALTFATISFGQAMSATAIQITSAYSAIANGGILMKPIIIKSIGGRTERRFESKEIRRVVSKKTAENIRILLKDAVDRGTGRSARVAGYSVGGKTGTGQKYDAQLKKYSTQKDTSSFAGMIPAENPRVVIFVMFNEPRGDYYAASIAAPVFRRIAERTARHLNIPKQ
jgi:cell division protein FtsI (penicillin-binding protein 3)